MFCPKCKAEYRSGFTSCSDCDVELIDSLAEPEQVRPRTDELVDTDAPVEIGRFVNIRQAEFAVSVLEGSGIEAFIDQSFIGNIAPHYLLSVAGGIRLFVRANDVKWAMEVLQSPEDPSEWADQKE